ncbi:uncharacterized protein LOC125944248 [Dermacentor silvarum]|uniref:uncharacterized protein LOC125944248 n=1 Tax=Dermacentor silvarum TaxID=543639 RepID=UPI002100CB03|nr:uncharacterized protein LOC125944248 [Dermacentor silvarum]
MEVTCLDSNPAETGSSSKTAEHSRSITKLSPCADASVGPPANSAHGDGSNDIAVLPPIAVQPVPAATPDLAPRFGACNVCLGVCAVLLFVLSALFAGMMTFHTFRRVEFVSRLLQEVVNETRRLDMRAAAATLDATTTPLLGIDPASRNADDEGVAIDNGTGVYF